MNIEKDEPGGPTKINKQLSKLPNEYRFKAVPGGPKRRTKQLSKLPYEYRFKAVT